MTDPAQSGEIGVQPWVMLAYLPLIGTLLGFGVGYAAWQLFGDPPRLCILASADRCPADHGEQTWTFVVGAVGAALGLAAAVTLRLLRGRE